jgi:hypothetical protein
MSAPFPRWEDALASASDDTARRALLAEVGRWRAAHLIDVVGQRDSAWAMAHLHAALGDQDAAVTEARSLMSLCRTPPAAEDAAVAAARDLVQRLTGARPKPMPGGPAPSGGRERGRDKGRKGGVGGLSPAQQAVVHARAGQWSQAFAAVKGHGEPRYHALRAWIDLERALGEPHGEARDKRLGLVRDRLEKLLPDVPGEPAAAEPAPRGGPARAPETRAEKLVGQALGGRRDKRLRALSRWLDDHPDRADALAAAVLLDHLDAAGTDAPAPWLVGYVARALVDEAPETRAALETLREAGSTAVLAYGEGPFDRLVALWGEARHAGLELRDLRRGITGREPEDRRIWTARLGRGEAEVMVAVAPDRPDPYPEGQAGGFAKRIVDLSDRALLQAPGAGNAGLREAAAALDVPVVPPEGDLVQAVLDRLGAGPAAPPVPAPAVAAPVERSRGPSHADRVAAVREALSGDPAPGAEELEPLVGPIKRVRDVLDLLEAFSGPDREARTVAAVTALHRTAPPHVRMMQATSVLLQVAADSGPEGAAARLLTEGEVAARLGGPGMAQVVALAVALQRAGWGLDRVLQGVTRRERRENTALDALADHAEGLWRLVVVRGDHRAEVWTTEDLGPEGRAVVPQLTRADPAQVAALPTGPLLDAWPALQGPPAVPWSGQIEAILEALPA